MNKSYLLKLIACGFLITAVGFDEAETLEPVTTTVAVGTAILGSAIFASYDYVKNKYFEGCQEPWVEANITGKSNSKNKCLLLCFRPQFLEINSS